MDKYVEKRDALIYSVVIERHRLEWQRTNDLNGKASSLAGFSGVMATLHSGIVRLLFPELSTSNARAYVAMAPLFLLGLAFFFALGAYWIKTWEAIDPSTLIEDYKDKEYEVVLRRVAATTSEMTMKNRGINNNKVKFLKLSLVTLALGVVSMFVVPFIPT